MIVERYAVLPQGESPDDAPEWFGNPIEARQEAQRRGLQLIVLTFEFAGSELVEDFTTSPTTQEETTQ